MSTETISVLTGVAGILTSSLLSLWLRRRNLDGTDVRRSLAVIGVFGGTFIVVGLLGGPLAGFAALGGVVAMGAIVAHSWRVDTNMPYHPARRYGSNDGIRP